MGDQAKEKSKKDHPQEKRSRSQNKVEKHHSMENQHPSQKRESEKHHSTKKRSHSQRGENKQDISKQHGSVLKNDHVPKACDNIQKIGACTKSKHHQGEKASNDKKNIIKPGLFARAIQLPTQSPRKQNIIQGGPETQHWRAHNLNTPQWPENLKQKSNYVPPTRSETQVSSGVPWLSAKKKISHDVRSNRSSDVHSVYTATYLDRHPPAGQCSTLSTHQSSIDNVDHIQKTVSSRSNATPKKSNIQILSDEDMIEDGTWHIGENKGLRKYKSRKPAIPFVNGKGQLQKIKSTRNYK